MSYYKTRKAAWTAMILMDHLQLHGVIQFTPLADGSVRFYAKGLWSILSWNGQKLVLTPCVVVKKAPKPVDVRIPTTADMFEQRGDKWNAHNIQHDAWNPDSHIRTNAFGDLCQKPTVEGYDEYGVLNHDRKAHQRLVRLQERKEPVDTSARRFANIRDQFRKGTLRLPK